jgi:hypothetical protein
MKSRKLYLSITTAVTLFSLPLPIEAAPIKLTRSNQIEQSISSVSNVIRQENTKQINQIATLPVAQTIDLKLNGSQIIAKFIPKNYHNQKISLNELASSLGYDHFNWVSYVSQDPYGIADKNGKPLATPYNDPPQGGYYYDSADHLPFYWDVDKCDRCSSRYYYKNPKITNDFELVFKDIPSDYRLKPGESIEFVTHLVGVESLDFQAGNARWQPLYTFKWKLTNSPLGEGIVSLIKENVNLSDLPLSLQNQMLIDGATFSPLNSKLEKNKTPREQNS